MSTVDVYIGTRRSLRRCSKLIWQLGPCHFLEEPIPAAEAVLMYQLGPSYLGSFQAPFINKNNHSVSWIMWRAIPHLTIPYHAMPSHAMPCHTIPYHTMPCYAIPYHTIRYDTIRYDTIPYHTIPYHTQLYHTILNYTMPCQSIPYHG